MNPEQSANGPGAEERSTAEGEAPPDAPLDVLAWGARMAEDLLRIGRAIGFGRAQQILGEQWEAEHDCAPRGRMGVTLPAPLADRPTMDSIEWRQYVKGWNECLAAVTSAEGANARGSKR